VKKMKSILIASSVVLAMVSSASAAGYIRNEIRATPALIAAAVHQNPLRYSPASGYDFHFRRVHALIQVCAWPKYANGVPECDNPDADWEFLDSP
jgi:hypothetical protein